MRAAWLSASTVARILIGRGARVDAVTSGGETALHHAAARCVDTVRLLLQNGANANVASKGHGTTPLIVAAFAAEPEAVKLLIAHGANVNAIESDGKSALYHAAERAPTPNQTRHNLYATQEEAARARALEDRLLRVAKILLESGADVRGGEHPRHILTAAHSVRMAELLRRHGAEGVSSADREWSPALE